MADKYYIDLEGLQEFKNKCDETYGGNTGTTLYQHNVYMYVNTNDSSSSTHSGYSVDAIEIVPLNISESESAAQARVIIAGAGIAYCFFSVMSTTSTPISSVQELFDLLADKGYIKATGYTQISFVADTTTCDICAITLYNSTTIYFYGIRDTTMLYRGAIYQSGFTIYNIIDTCTNLSDGTSTTNQITSS